MKLQLPLDGIGTKPGIYLTQKFGENPQIYAQFGINGHNGLDWAAPLGTPVKAVHDGYIIESTAKDTGYGLRVSQLIISGGKYYVAIYGHFQKLIYPDIPWNYYDRSRPVKDGDVIGYVNSTGFSTGNHLHFGLYEFVNGQTINTDNGFKGAIDPEPFFKGETMRLVNDNGTTYLVAGVNKKVKLGISDLETLALFGDEPVEVGNTQDISETHTIAHGFVVHKK